MPLKWPAEEIRVCLIGYHGALFNLAEVFRGNGIDIACIVTHIDDRAGKQEPEATLSRSGLFEPMSKIADVAGAPLLYVEDPNAPEAIAAIKETGANVAFSISAPIIKAAFLEYFDGWVFNLHGSRHYRGRAGLSWNILNGVADDSVVLHWIDLGIDTGDAVSEVPYAWPENPYPIDLFRAQRKAYGDLAETWIKFARNGGIPKIGQDSTRVYLPSLYTDEDGWIDWNRPAAEAERVIRAFGWPYAGASSYMQGASRKTKQLVRIARAHVAESPAPALHWLANGSVLSASRKRGVDVACGGGVIHIESLRDRDDEVPAGEIIRVGMRMRGKP